MKKDNNIIQKTNSETAGLTLSMRSDFIFKRDSNTMLRYAIENEYPEDERKFFDSIDMVVFWYRIYLVTDGLNLRGVNQRIKDMKSSRHYSESVLKDLIGIVENDLLESELYEIMPKHLKAKPKLMRV